MLRGGGIERKMQKSDVADKFIAHGCMGGVMEESSN